MSKKVEWIQAASLIAGSVIAIAKTVIQYNEFKREQGTLEYTRELQRRAWDKVISGELAEAKVGEMTIRGVRDPALTESKDTKTQDNKDLNNPGGQQDIKLAASTTQGRSA